MLNPSLSAVRRLRRRPDMLEVRSARVTFGTSNTGSYSVDWSNAYAVQHNAENGQVRAHDGACDETCFEWMQQNAQPTERPRRASREDPPIARSWQQASDAMDALKFAFQSFSYEIPTLHRMGCGAFIEHQGACTPACNQWMHDHLLDHLRDEARRRQYATATPSPGTLAAAQALFALPTTATLADAKRRYRELAAVHHPDHGGDEAKMKEVNAAYDLLRAYAGLR